QKYGELTSLVSPLAETADFATVEFGQIFDQRETDPKTALSAIRCPVGLGKQVKDMRLQVSRDADAIVLDRQSQQVRADFQAYMDGAALRRIFGCVVKQIGDDLHQALLVPQHISRFCSQVEVEMMALCFDKWPDLLDGVINNRFEVERIFVDGDQAPRHP